MDSAVGRHAVRTCGVATSRSLHLVPLRGSTRPLPSATPVPYNVLGTTGKGGACRAASGSAGSAAAAVATTSPTQATSPQQQQIDIDDFASDKRPIILFDGVCNLCNNGVNFMLDQDPKGVFRLAALQSPAGRRLLRRCGRAPDDISSIVLVERDRHYIRSEAILRIGRLLNGPLPLPLLAAAGFPVPLPLRDAFYDQVANNRYSFFGRTDQCRLRDAGKYKDRFIVE